MVISRATAGHSQQQLEKRWAEAWPWDAASSLDGSTQLQMLSEGSTSQADAGSAGKGSRRRWGGVVGSRLYQQEPAESNA